MNFDEDESAKPSDFSELEHLLKDVLGQVQTDLWAIKQIAGAAMYIPMETPVRLVPFVTLLLNGLQLEVRVMPTENQHLIVQGCGSAKHEQN